MNPDIIFFIGPQGSGKGTQARMLAERLNFFYWEMGGIIRQVSQEDSPVGKRARELNEQGVLFPDDFLLEIVKSRIDAIPAGQGIIFDGIPRRIGQAEYLFNYLKEQNRGQRATTLFIDLPHDESLKRLLARAEVEKRKDDTQEAIEFRLAQYQKDTIPVLDFLKQKTMFITIDGRPAVEQVTAAINEALHLN